jgi:hypothetical protein
MKQEIVKIKFLIMAVCAFGAFIVVGMFAAAGYF